VNANANRHANCPLTCGANWAQLILANNTGGGGTTIYVDNIAVNVVPQPAAASLTGLGLAVLVIRRRCQY
jgi:hypothetical protein